MEFTTFSFRNAEIVFKQPHLVSQYEEIISVVQGISDNELIEKHNSLIDIQNQKGPKSLSQAINILLKKRFVELGWSAESYIFKDSAFRLNDTWRLDFAKEEVSIEVAFNHSTGTAWNLLKPVIASELNHVEKAIQTSIGVIISETREMKIAGGFDNAVGTHELFIEYLAPLRNFLTVPILFIGLKAPRTFRIRQTQVARRKKIGEIEMI